MNPSTRLVTGATDGIGRQTAPELGRNGALEQVLWEKPMEPVGGGVE